MKYKKQINPNAVLNGIAYDKENKKLFITGKLWENIFEISI
ncbi:MAG: glutaminyl-peptide cyclotransferase [Candidatus Sericytochromatia bacterium]